MNLFTDAVWVFTRERSAPGVVLQSAYGVLDRYRISRTFFVKTDQKDCDTLPPPTEAEQTRTDNAEENIVKEDTVKTKLPIETIKTEEKVEVETDEDKIKAESVEKPIEVKETDKKSKRV